MNESTGPIDSRVSTLQSIANSIEPAFPNAADALRGIAASLEVAVGSNA